MKIVEFPEVQLKVKLYPKKRGLWRPKLEIWLDYQWPDWNPSPFFIIFSKRTDLIQAQDNTLIDGITKFYLAESIALHLIGEHIVRGRGFLVRFPADIYNSPNRPEDDDYIQTKKDGFAIFLRSQSPAAKLTMFVEWRPGRPDYADVLEVVKRIPYVIQLGWRDGLHYRPVQGFEWHFSGRPIPSEFKRRLK